jgi:hypothetical protein
LGERAGRGQQVAREPLEGRGARRGLRVRPPDELDVFARHRHHEVGLTQVVGRDLAAPVGVVVHAEGDERAPGAHAHGHPLDDMGAARDDDDLGVVSEQCTGHDRPRGISRAERDHERHRCGRLPAGRARGSTLRP